MIKKCLWCGWQGRYNATECPNGCEYYYLKEYNPLTVAVFGERNYWCGRILCGYSQACAWVKYIREKVGIELTPIADSLGGRVVAHNATDFEKVRKWLGTR